MGSTRGLPSGILANNGLHREVREIRHSPASFLLRDDLGMALRAVTSTVGMVCSFLGLCPISVV